MAGARAEYERALQLDPIPSKPFTALSMLDLRQKNGARAQSRASKRTWRSRPDHPELLTLAARSTLPERDFPKAEQLLRHLIEVDPSNMAGYSMLGQVYLMQQKLDAAKAEFDKRIRNRIRRTCRRTWWSR